MNENDSILDAREQHRNVESTEPADAVWTPHEVEDMPRPEVAGAELSEEPIAEDVVAAGQEESATEHTAADDSGCHDTPADGESAPTLPDGDAEASLSESDAGGADAPPAERDGQTEPGEGAEQRQRRVVLQAGTDEESLKALALCREKVTQLRLRMHPLAARWESDRHVIIFFRADEKVDFRKLVRELSHLLHARIELRQVGPREQGKLCGLVGKCGYPLCCQTFLGQFAQSTIKMAKTQELALNPMKISGVCGRLLCCLNYEQQMYLDARANMPRVNKTVDTEFGPGRVVAVNVLKQTVTVQLETATRELRPEQILPPQPQG